MEAIHIGKISVGRPFRNVKSIRKFTLDGCSTEIRIDIPDEEVPLS